VSRETSRWQRVLRSLTANKGALIGLFILIILVLAALLAPLITAYDPIKINPPARLQPPNRTHWMGTDNFGRDLYTRVVYGARISLPVGLIAVAISAVFGTLLGLVAGYYGRFVDGVIMRLIDIMLAFPGILLALVVVAILGTNLQNVMIAVGISGVPRFCRLIRGSVLSARENLYVDAARVVGAPTPLILFRHILPNVIGPGIVLSTLSVGSAILAAAGLSFLGLGSQPPTPEWGSMLQSGKEFLSVHPLLATAPGIAVVLTGFALSLIGDGLAVELGRKT
jgi:peptide/nickel transport system permease protein